MCRFSVWILPVLLAAGAAGLGRADDPASDDSTPAKKSWFASLWGGKSKPAAKAKQDVSPEAAAAQKRFAAVSAARASKARELSDWTRRVAACDRLREIANLTNDAELRRKADQLDQRAFVLYRNKTETLAGGPAGLQGDERILERRLGAGTSTAQNLLPATGGGAASQAAIREVQP